jgi:hypothetical protein
LTGPLPIIENDANADRYNLSFFCIYIIQALYIVKPTLVQLTKNMQVLITLRWTKTQPIILDKENIQPNAHGNHSHVGIGTPTTTGSALSVASGKDQLTSCLFQRVTLFYNLYCNNIMTSLTNEALQIFLTLQWTKGTRNNGKEELR